MNIKVFEQKIWDKMKSFALSKEAQENIKATKDDKDYIVRFKISWEDIDRDWEIIKSEGIDWSHFDNNPVILIDHNYKVWSIAWKALRREVKWTDTFLIVQLAKGVAAWELIKKLHMQGMIKGVSIGFMAKERDKNDSKIITKSEALEASFVTMWSYRDALIDDQALEKSCKEAGLLEVPEEKALTASNVKTGDVVSYRHVHMRKNDAGEMVEHFWPRLEELPRVAKVLEKYEAGENILQWWEKVIVWSKEDPILVMQWYITSKQGPVMLNSSVWLYQATEIKLEKRVSKKEVENGDEKFTSDEAKEMNLDSNEILASMKEIWDEVKSFKSCLKTFADDNAKIEKLETARKAGQNFAWLLWDALKELKK